MVSEKIIILAQRFYSFPRSSVGMHTVWVPTPEHGNQAMGKKRLDRTQIDDKFFGQFSVCLACVLMITAFAVVGCGRKGPPQPPKSSMPPGISGIDARVDGNNIVLSWRVKKNAKNIPAGFFIYRGLVVCASCPVKSVRIARVSYKSESVHVFVDNPLRYGRYEYRVACVDEYGIEGPVSKVAVFLPEDDNLPVAP